MTCVRWDPRGEMLANTSYDGSIALTDSRTGKILYSGERSTSKFD